MPRLIGAAFLVQMRKGRRKEGDKHGTRIAVIGIVVEEEDSVEILNEILHEIPTLHHRTYGNSISEKRSECHQHCGRCSSKYYFRPYRKDRKLSGISSKNSLSECECLEVQKNTDGKADADPKERVNYYV